jgi:hypothetical protein
MPSEGVLPTYEHTRWPPVKTLPADFIPPLTQVTADATEKYPFGYVAGFSDRCTS